MASPNHQIPSPSPSPPSLEELSRRGVRSLFLPYIIGLISDSTPQQSPQSPREVLVLVDFRTGSITMVEGSGQIEAFLRGKEGPLPASKASIEALETVEVMEEGLECSICLTEFENKNKYEGGPNKEMPCGHRFHAPCIGKWLGIHGSCPICRYQMPPENEKNSRKIEADNESELIDNIDDDDNEEEEEEDDETPPPPRGDESDGFSGAGFVFHIYVAGSRRGESGLDLDPDEENSGSGSDMEIDDSD